MNPFWVNWSTRGRASSTSETRRRSAKRIAGGVLLLLAVQAVPATAGPGNSVDVELKGVQRGAVVEGTIPLSATASSPAGIKRLDIAINDRVVSSVEPPGIKQSADLSFSWVTSVRLDSDELASNGEYLVAATAVANGGADAKTIYRVIVDNPAATPTELSATVTGDGVALTWDRNPEPDLIGYEVERSIEGEFEILGRTTQTSAVDPVDPGTYSYRVTAIRSSAARSSGRPSTPSEEIVVTIQAAVTDSRGGEPSRGAGSFGRGRGFRVEDAAIAPRGLPSGATLPGAVGLPGLPAPALDAGTYENELPYDIPEGGIPLSAAGTDREAGTWTPVPADGLRWIAAGFLLIALATLLRLLARRLDAVATGAPLDL